MYLKTLQIRQFRNYQDQKVDFLAPKTILVGDNAQGKSNLLEAVELLATLRSHRNSRDRDLVKESELVGQISATIERQNSTNDLSITLRRNGRRSVAKNSETLRRQLDFLGVLNAVQFSSLDLDLVRGGPEQRRHWIDTLLIQLEPIYAYILQQYNQVLRQRNAFLKQVQELGIKDREQELALWNVQLAVAGSRVTRRRSRAVERLAPIASAWHCSISGSTEKLEIQYAPNISLEQNEPEQVQQTFFSQNCQ